MENNETSFDKRFDKGIIGFFQRIIASLPFGLLVMLAIILSFVLLYLETYLYIDDFVETTLPLLDLDVSRYRNFGS